MSNKNELTVSQYRNGELMPYGADSIAARLAATPDSPYLDYITSLAAGSIPIVRSTLTRVSELLYQCAPEKAPWHLMTAKEFNFLRHHLESQGFAPKTIHPTLGFVRSTLKRARQRDLIPESNVGQYAVIMATENVKGSTGRGEIAPHRSLSDDEIDTLFRHLAADKSNAGCRDLAIISCMRGCGLRRMDVAGFTVEDIRWSAGEYGELRIKRSKGGKTRVMPMPRGLREILGRWMEIRGEQLGPLFVRIHKSDKLIRVTQKYVKANPGCGVDVGDFQHMDRSSINRMMERRLIAAGLAKASPHDLRYTFAQKGLRRSDLQTVCDLLGHSSVTTTSIYTETSQERLREVVGGDAVFDLLELTDDAQ